MKLTDKSLEAKFLIFTNQKGVLRTTTDRQKAQGLYFNCPKCKGDHAYTLLFNDCGVPEKAKPLGRWTAIGESLHDLALLEIIRGECGWRGCLRGGEILSTYE